MIRRGVPADLPLLLGLAEEYCAADGHVFRPDRTRMGFVPLLESDELGLVWVVCDGDGAPEGYVVVTWGWSIESGGRDALLDEVYVRSRGRGLGSGALRAVLADLRERGLGRVFLETERPNEAARRLYMRLGFTPEDSVWMSLDLLPGMDGGR